jgi:hypothetical protein
LEVRSIPNDKNPANSEGMHTLVTPPRKRRAFGIILSADEVRTTLDSANPRTQIRKIIKAQPDIVPVKSTSPLLLDGHGFTVHSPYGVAGDLLWVREAFGRHESIQQVCGYVAEPEALEMGSQDEETTASAGASRAIDSDSKIDHKPVKYRGLRTCQECGARDGERCMTRSGKYLTVPHGNWEGEGWQEKFDRLYKEEGW